MAKRMPADDDQLSAAIISARNAEEHYLRCIGTRVASGRSMPRQPFRVAMFLSSYSPLFALLAYTNRHVPGAWVALGAVAVVSVLGLAAVMLGKRGERGPRLIVAHAKPQDRDVLAYIATYLIPFLGIDLSKRDDVVVLCAFLLVLMLVYVNSSMLFVNPLLSLAGYNSFEVADRDGHIYALLSRRDDLEPDTVLRPAQVTRYLRVEVRRERPNEPH